MAKKSSVEKEKRKARTLAKYAAKRNNLRAVIKSPHSSLEEKLAAQASLQKLPRDSMRARKRNRCLITGRVRGFIREWGLSRIQFRSMAHRALLPGVQKSSW